MTKGFVNNLFKALAWTSLLLFLETSPSNAETFRGDFHDLSKIALPFTLPKDVSLKWSDLAKSSLKKEIPHFIVEPELNKGISSFLIKAAGVSESDEKSFSGRLANGVFIAKGSKTYYNQMTGASFQVVPLTGWYSMKFPGSVLPTSFELTDKKVKEIALELLTKLGIKTQDIAKQVRIGTEEGHRKDDRTKAVVILKEIFLDRAIQGYRVISPYPTSLAKIRVQNDGEIESVDLIWKAIKSEGSKPASTVTDLSHALSTGMAYIATAPDDMEKLAASNPVQIEIKELEYLIFQRAPTEKQKLLFPILELRTEVRLKDGAVIYARIFAPAEKL